MGLLDSIGDIENAATTAVTFGAYNPATGKSGGLGDSLMKPLGDIKDTINPPGPTGYNQPAIDTPLQNSIDQQSRYAQIAGRTPQWYADQTMKGVDQGSKGGLSSGGQIDSSNAALGGGDPGLGGAIAAKANKHYDQNLGALNAQALTQGALEQVQRSNNATDMQVNLANAQRGINVQAAEYQVKADASRNAVLEGLFTGAGSFAGQQAARNNTQQSYQPSTANLNQNAYNDYNQNYNTSGSYANSTPSYSSEAPYQGSGT